MAVGTVSVSGRKDGRLEMDSRSAKSSLNISTYTVLTHSKVLVPLNFVKGGETTYSPVP